MTIRLENWSVTFVAPPGMDINYTPPEMWRQALQGNSHGDPRRSAEGNWVTTSPIVKKTADGQRVCTMHTEYELGVVDPEYEKKFPNARQRLFDSLKGEC